MLLGWSNCIRVALIGAVALFGCSCTKSDSAGSGKGKAAKPARQGAKKANKLPSLVSVKKVKLTEAPWVGLLAFSRDGKQLAVTANDKPVLLYDAQTWKVRDRVPATRALAGTFLPGGKLATASAAELVEVWPVDSKKVARLSGHKSWVRSVAADSKGTWLISGGDSGAFAWRVAKGQVSTSGVKLAGPKSSVMSVAVAPNGATAAAAGKDGTIWIWKPGESNAKHAIEVGGWVNALAYLPDGRTLISGDDKGRVRLWDVAAGKQLHQFAVGTPKRHIKAIAVAPGGGAFVYATGKKIIVVDVKSRRKVGMRTHDATVTELAFASDGRLASGGESEWLYIWQLRFEG
jgi:WD40 repeat protein